MTRIVRIALVVLFAAMAAAPLVAQDAVPPRFFIERIEVREAERVSPEVVVAESRLRDGHEYSEADLRDAAARLSRLPFLLSAEFSLEKGSERGHYLLVITINETKGFFYALDYRPILTNDHTVEVDYSDRIGQSETSGTLGVRWFLGRRGALHVAFISSEYDREFARNFVAIAVGYTQYDLFGTRAFATLSLKQLLGEDSTGLSPQLVIGIPLSANQTLTVELDETTFGRDVLTIFDEPIETSRGQRIVGATWSYNTTNRPFLPTRGTLLSLQPRISWSDAATYIFVPEDIGEPYPGLGVVSDSVHTRSYQIRANAAQHWELSERTSVSAGIETAWTDYEADSRVLGITEDKVLRAVVMGGYSYSLWSAEQMRNGDSRLEFNVRIGNRSIRYYDIGEVDQQQVSASWVRRSSWGTLRFGVGFAW